ncbi:sensor histidine kinase [Prauserella cavernicola]|uniref:sensor histidine kinase n=1 Tax=Prauserella cavernicola TaxID=2800127 RepID=UPI0027DE446E|nr:histidine kinase [Prauserella cavernicola]
MNDAGTRVRGMRLYTLWSLMAIGGFCLVPPVILLAENRFDGPGVWLLCTVAGVLAVQRARLVRQAVHHAGQPLGLRAELLVTLALAIAACSYAFVVDPEPMWWGFLPAVVGGAVVLNLPAEARWRAATVVSVVTALCAAAATVLWAQGDYPTTGWFSVAVLVLVLLSLDVAQLWLWDIVTEVDRARATAGELAVARERLRFAADLHDIQGHHLQAIMLKGELTERLIGRDDDAARAQAAELTELARTALTDTREVVHGYRSTDLGTELTNAVELLRAAGIRTTVSGSADTVPPPLRGLFGALVREGTTNILRHSQASTCELTFDVADGRARVRLGNDGVSPAEVDPGSGIASLRERFATMGGEVSALSADGRFELSGSAAEPGGVPA